MKVIYKLDFKQNPAMLAQKTIESKTAGLSTLPRKGDDIAFCDIEEVEAASMGQVGTVTSVARQFGAESAVVRIEMDGVQSSDVAWLKAQGFLFTEG